MYTVYFRVPSNVVVFTLLFTSCGLSGVTINGRINEHRLQITQNY